MISSFGVGSALAESPRERAGQHVVSGDALKVRAEDANDAGDSEEAGRLFDLAAEQYLSAYELVPHPLMLYNLAQVYRLGGRLEEALKMYTDFLASNPTGTAADFARKYERILQRTVGDGADDDEDDDDDDGPEDDDDDEDDDDLVGGSGGSQDKGLSGKTLKFGGLATAVVGAISLGVGVKYGIDARDMASCLGANYPAGCQGFLSQAAIDAGQWSDEADALEKNTLPQTKNKMYLFGGIGVVAVVGGAILYFLGDDKIKAQEGRQSLRIVPQVNEESTGLALIGQF
jgi:tetratricopeptide (TPR) repeat protein